MRVVVIECHQTPIFMDYVFLLFPHLAVPKPTQVFRKGTVSTKQELNKPKQHHP